jgi:uncharacterized Zn finger protein
MTSNSFECSGCKRRKTQRTAEAKPRLIKCANCGTVLHYPVLASRNEKKPYERRTMTNHRYSNRNT